MGPLCLKQSGAEGHQRTSSCNSGENSVYQKEKETGATQTLNHIIIL